jgi:hypothetical protein
VIDYSRESQDCIGSQGSTTGPAKKQLDRFDIVEANSRDHEGVGTFIERSLDSELS